MRLLTPLRLVWVGLALAAPASVLAGSPEDCPTCAAQSTQSPHLFKHTHHSHLCAKCQGAHHSLEAGTTVPGGHLCAKCAAHLQQQGGMSGPMVAMSEGSPTPVGTCTTCQGMAAGHAYVGDTSGSMAPGYAMVGGMSGSTEPAPVGVMRTNYHTTGMATAATPRPGGGPVPMAPVPSARPHVLRHLFGLNGMSDWSHDRLARRRERHAAISYGAVDSTPSEVPASLVYGRHGW